MTWPADLSVAPERALVLIAVFIAALMITIMALGLSRRAARYGREMERARLAEEKRSAADAERMDDRNAVPNVETVAGDVAAADVHVDATPTSSESRNVMLGVAAIAPEADRPSLLKAIDIATAMGANERLPELNLSLAEWHLANGSPEKAEELLRACVRGATEFGLKEPHARARVILGDFAQANGDPSTACEHWQIARILFHEIGDKPAYDDVDIRMQRNGCPSDWVLTDF
ncbi:hypothetical protein APY04_3064 [Hyphomicrobium sulfonivorans]|uniref:Uncharacterized protein n=1 Tax=Hyphomicrobium sulfonivorans TaxID=121290 RepID=A0A109BA27_HYPSL|nr:hypothetical protein [Hyphomicrobium sulfonivorans]KWT64976.1 hypothetical protein APY04_3064 [Hyphomicrobium sulfonivorans]